MLLAGHHGLLLLGHRGLLLPGRHGLLGLVVAQAETARATVIHMSLCHICGVLGSKGFGSWGTDPSNEPTSLTCPALLPLCSCRAPTPLQRQPRAPVPRAGAAGSRGGPGGPSRSRGSRGPRPLQR